MSWSTRADCPADFLLGRSIAGLQLPAPVSQETCPRYDERSRSPQSAQSIDIVNHSVKQPASQSVSQSIINN
eukprot:scaffold85686_cov51-Prasinocladus_malaysianus.AAC.1